MIINCPSCHKEFTIIAEEPDINRRIACPHCLTQFEVTWLYPFTMDYAEEIPLNSNQSIESPVN
jgi:hypothetical protein